MTVTRRGSGPEATVRAYLSQVHPVFMLPPLAASSFGAVLAGSGDPAGHVALAPAAVHVVAIFAAVYTAHLKDGYVDFHVRDEDDDHPLTVVGCRLGLVLSTGLFALACVLLLILATPLAVALTIPTWFIAYGHAPQLDTNPVTATSGYPAGIALAVLGGFAVQTGTIDALSLAFAVVFLVLLSGIKVVDDAQDYDYDRSIEKRTVAVLLGPERAHTVAYGLMGLALIAVVGFTAMRIFPVTSVLATLAFAGVAGIAWRAPPSLATMLLVRGSYVFLALLVAAVWFDPLPVGVLV